MSARTGLAYGLLAEFERPEVAVEAARRARSAGYTRVSAYSPFPVPELSEAVGVRRPWIPAIVLAGGVAGGAGGFLMQWWMAAVAYPLDVAGRPLLSWPAFVPVTFELAVLGAALAGAFGLLVLAGLPRLYHPLDASEDFRRATQDRFFVCVEASDPRFDARETRRLFEEVGAARVSEVSR